MEEGINEQRNRWREGYIEIGKDGEMNRQRQVQMEVELYEDMDRWRCRSIQKNNLHPFFSQDILGYEFHIQNWGGGGEVTYMKNILDSI